MLIIMAYVKVSKIPRHLAFGGEWKQFKVKDKDFQSLTLRKLYKVVHKTKGD